MTLPSKQGKKRTTGPILWPVVLVITGVVLLLDNFLLLGDFNAAALLPLLLVIAGAQILLRGDLLPSAEARSFGITRGSVESATLEISSGEVDVQVRSLKREGRLIAGQYAPNARPELQVDDTYTHLKMQRNRTPWYAFADWQVAVARDLPWQVLVSTYLGQVELDLNDVIIHDAVIATGIGHIRLIAPYEAFGAIVVRSALGNVHINTPIGTRSVIYVEGGRLFNVHVDDYRYTLAEPDVYAATDPEPEAPIVEIRVAGTFGDLFLS